MSASEPTPAPVARQSILGLAASWAARGGIGGLLIWLCFWSLQGITALVDSPVVEDASPQPTFNLTELLSSEKLESGAWSFLDEAWELTAESVPTAEASRRMAAPPQVLRKDPPANSEQTRDLLQLLREFGTKTNDGTYSRYALKQSGFEVVGFAIRKPQEQLVSVRWLLPLAKGKSWIVEQSPKEKVSTPTQPSVAIIPARVPNQLLVQRADSTGQTVCQLFRVDSSLSGLLDELHREDWKFDAPAGQTQSQFVTILLSRRAESFWMIATPITDTKSLRVLLLRDGTLSASESAQPSTEVSP